MKISLFVILSIIIYTLISIGVIILIVTNAHPSKHTNNNLQNIYRDAATYVFSELNDMKREWWPTEGTLLGIIRWGDNFGSLEEGIIATDVDIDLMIRVDDDEDWEQVRNELSNRLLKKIGWTHCKLRKVNGIAKSKKPKLTCYTPHYFGSLCGPDSGIHVDIHRYMVNEKSNTIFTDYECDGNPHKCKNKYPFQAWGGTAPYKGLIVNENGEFSKAKFNNMEVPCPYMYEEILSKWNGNEYGSGETLHLPAGQISLCNKVDKEKNNMNIFTWKKNGFDITGNDWTTMCESAKELQSKGYASFSSRYNMGNCPSFWKGPFKCRHGRKYCFGKNAIFYDTTVRELLNLHEKLKDIWFITGGTLLGYARENNLLRNDDDVDMGFFATSLDVFDTIEKVFQDNGYRKKIFWTSENPFNTNGKRRKIPGQYTFSKHTNGHKIEFDISPIWINDKTKTYNLLTFFNKKIQKHEFTPFKIQTTKFLGTSFNIPSDYKKYLSEHYGKDWMVEKSNFGYKEYSSINN